MLILIKHTVNDRLFLINGGGGCPTAKCAEFDSHNYIQVNPVIQIWKVARCNIS